MSNLKFIIPITIVLLITTLGLFFAYKSSRLQINNGLQLTESLDTSNQPPAPPPSLLTSPPPQAVLGTQAPPSQPQSGSSTQQVQNPGIYIDSPVQQLKISSPVVVRGRANVIGGQVLVRIKNAAGDLLGYGSAMACLGYDACPFETDIYFNSPNTQNGYIEVFASSNDNFQENDLQTIPVSF